VIFFGLCGFLKSSHLRQASGGLNCSNRAIPVDTPWFSSSYFSLNWNGEDDPWLQWWCTSPQLHFDVFFFRFHYNLFSCAWWPELVGSPEKMVVSTTIPTCLSLSPWIVSKCYNLDHPMWLLVLMSCVASLTQVYNASAPLSPWCLAISINEMIWWRWIFIFFF